MGFRSIQLIFIPYWMGLNPYLTGYIPSSISDGFSVTVVVHNVPSSTNINKFLSSTNFLASDNPKIILNASSMDPVQLLKTRRHNYEFVREVVLETLKQDSDYLSVETLRRWKVRCSDLDLHTGTFSDQGPAFISPYPLAKFNSILNEKAPWEIYQLCKEKDSFNMSAAYAVGSLLKTYLRAGRDQLGIMFSTRWETRLYVTPVFYPTLPN